MRALPSSASTSASTFASRASSVFSLLSIAVLASTIAAGVAACSSSDPLTSPTAADGGGAPKATSTTDPGPPDAAGNPDNLTRDAGPDAPVFAGPTLDVSGAADAIAAAECAFLERCFTEYTNQYTGSLAGCTSGAATQLRGDYPASALFDLAAVDAAVTCFGTVSCDALYGSFGQTHCATPKPVNGAPVGAACNKANDCASSFCNGTSTAACGTCAPGIAVKLGDACDASLGKQCPAGSVCNGRCVIELGPGDACTTGTSTPPTSVCADSLECVGGTCTKTGGPGTACGTTGKCDTFQNQVCDQVSSQCTTIQWLASGATCTVNDDAHMCGGGERCIAPSGVTTGTCQAAAQPGQACVRTSSCTFGYDCKSNVCTAQGSTRPICK